MRFFNTEGPVALVLMLDEVDALVGDTLIAFQCSGLSRLFSPARGSRLL